MDKSYPTLFARLLLGVIFLMQGFGKVFTWGVSNVYNNGFKAYEETFLPKSIIQFTTYFTSYAELICGLLLILGLFRKQAYWILAIVLVIVSFGHGLTSPIWDLQHVFFRSALLLFLMMIPLEKDRFSLDSFLKTRKQ